MVHSRHAGANPLRFRTATQLFQCDPEMSWAQMSAFYKSPLSQKTSGTQSHGQIEVGSTPLWASLCLLQLGHAYHRVISACHSTHSGPGLASVFRMQNHQLAFGTLTLKIDPRLQRNQTLRHCMDAFSKQGSSARPVSSQFGSLKVFFAWE